VTKVLLILHDVTLFYDCGLEGISLVILAEDFSRYWSSCPRCQLLTLCKIMLLFLVHFFYRIFFFRAWFRSTLHKDSWSSKKYSLHCFNQNSSWFFCSFFQRYHPSRAQPYPTNTYVPSSVVL